MKPSQSSRTAEYMAFFRALESVRPEGQRLFHDPFAVQFLRARLRWTVEFSRVGASVASIIGRYADHRLPGARTSAIARTRFIDDSLRAFFTQRGSQLVILGAGFDCRAYRLPELAHVSVYELDHPATLSAKLLRLGRVLCMPENVRFVETDFNRMSLRDALDESDFDPSQPTLFLWEGVTNYLSEQAVDSVLRYVAACDPGSRIIFTYIHSGILDGSVFFDGAERLLRDVARLNEPWTFGIDPNHLAQFLRLRGLSLTEDVPAADYRRRYFGTAAQHMGGYEFYRIAVAEVHASSVSQKETAT